MIDRRNGKPKRFRGDAGAAMVEGAIVALPFFLLLFGILEFGFLFKDYLTVSNATTTGARAGAAAANNLSADASILSAIDEGAAALQRGRIQRIVVFRSVDGSGNPSPEGTVPSACLSGTAGVANQCNVYFPTDLLLAKSQFNCKTGTPPGVANDNNWCPTKRVAWLKNSADVTCKADYLGVYIAYRFDYITGLFGSSKIIEDTSITRLEPQSLTGGPPC